MDIEHDESEFTALHSLNEIPGFIKTLTNQQMDALIDGKLTNAEVNTLIKIYQQKKQANTEFWKSPWLNQTS